MAQVGRIIWHDRCYQRGDLRDAFLVFAATDNREVQRQVAAEAKANKILFNSVDDPDTCSFQVPARVRRGHFLLTVSTGGASPALAARLRRQLAAEYGKEYKPLVDLLGRIRKIIVADGKTSESHRILFERLVNQNILARIEKQEWAALENDLREILPDGTDVKGLIRSINPLERQGNNHTS